MTASEATFELARRCPLCGWCMAALLLLVVGAVQAVACFCLSYTLGVLFWLLLGRGPFRGPMEFLEIILRG